MPTNPKVIILSLLGLIFIALAFFLHWTFIIGAAITTFLGWRLLTKD